MVFSVSEPTHLGILGGGQLAGLLAQAANALSLPTTVFSESSKLCTFARQAALSIVESDDLESPFVQSGLAKVNHLTFENEWVSAQKLGQMELQFPSLELCPPLKAFECISDKLLQKKKIASLGIPTLPFLKWDFPTQSWEAFEKTVAQTLGYPCVLKLARGGYDGRGVRVVESQTAFLTEAKDWARKALSQSATKGDLYAEVALDSPQEFARVVVRGKDGCVVFFPLMQTLQRNGMCFVVQGPAREFGVSEECEKDTTRALTHLVESIEYVGALAAEFFYDGHELWVNELAPRVHNSGHYSSLALTHSQFDLHVRACCGLPLPQPVAKAPFFGMVNWLGAASELPPSPQWSARAHEKTGLELELFWYGKTGSSGERRKLGHVNALASKKSEWVAGLSQLVALRENEEA